MNPRAPGAPRASASPLREGMAFLATWAALAVLLAWAGGRLLNDRFGWSQYLWWIPSVAAISLAASGLALAMLVRPARRWGARFVLICGLIGAIAWTTLIEWRLISGRAPSTDSFPRVLFWNMAAKDAPSAPALLARQNPDLIILANPAYSSSRGEIEAAIAGSHALAELPECFIAWRGEIRAAGWTSLRLGAARPGMDPSDGGAAIDHGWAAWARLALPGGDDLVLWVIDAPADPRLPRTHLMQRIRRAIEAAREPFPKPDIIAGDFNTPRGSSSLRALIGPMTEAFAASGQGPGATWPRHLPLWALDQVFTGDRLRPIRAQVLDPGATTHRVIVVDFKQPEG